MARQKPEINDFRSFHRRGHVCFFGTCMFLRGYVSFLHFTVGYSGLHFPIGPHWWDMSMCRMHTYVRTAVCTLLRIAYSNIHVT